MNTMRHNNCNDPATKFKPRNATDAANPSGFTGYKEVLERIEKAENHVFDLCEGKTKWTMRVPANEEKDSDCIIMGALSDAKRIIASL